MRRELEPLAVASLVFSLDRTRSVVREDNALLRQLVVVLVAG
jgi:hypothetical protein